MSVIQNPFSASLLIILHEPSAVCDLVEKENHSTEVKQGLPVQRGIEYDLGKCFWVKSNTEKNNDFHFETEIIPS